MDNARIARREVLRGLDPARAVGDLHELGQLRDPSGERNRVARERPREALPVPTFVRRTDRVEYRLRETELSREELCQLRVPLDHPVHLAAT